MSSHDLQHNQRTCSNQLPPRPKRRSWPLDRQVVGGILNCGPQSLLRILTRLYSHSEKQFNGGPCYKVRLQREHPITYLYRICLFILRTLCHRADRYRPSCLDDRSNFLYEINFPTRICFRDSISLPLYLFYSYPLSNLSTCLKQIIAR